MPRVLMLCYYFPPIIASGTTRSVAFAKNLKALGWEPIVLTVKNCRDPWVKVGKDLPLDIRVERAEEWNLVGCCDLFHGICSRLSRTVGHDLKKNYFREMFCFPDPQVRWKPEKLGVELAKSCDIIYASCSPFSAALIASEIAKKSSKPFVLDFRDAWSLNPHFKYSDSHLRKIRNIESDLISRCKALILNTEGALNLYKHQYAQFSDKMYAIPNGYDELTPVRSSDGGNNKLTIMHVGSFYGNRSPLKLLEALAELPNISAEFVQVGGDFPESKEFADKVKITVHPPLPREEALRLMQTASILYLKQGEEPGVKDYVAVAAKTYEYLATGLPILAEVPEGDNSNIVREYAENAWIVNQPNKEHLKSALMDIYNSRATLKLKIKPEFVEDFSREHLTEKLAEVLSLSIK